MFVTILSGVKQGWRWQLAVLIAGALLSLSFAPTNFWPIAFPCLVVLGYCLRNRTPAQTAACGFLFAAGMYATGVHWIFVPIDQYSSTPTFFGVLIVIGFVMLLAAVFFALPFYAFGRWCANHSFSILLGLPALWVFTEWLRTWLFTGFPWLFLGYGHLQTWLAGWAPITGVMGLSFIVAFTAGVLVHAWLNRKDWRGLIAPVGVCALLWIGGALANSVQWTQSYGEPVSVGLAQGNIAPDKKWLPDYLQPTLDRYFSLSENLWDNDWVVWPEAAIPLIANTRRDYPTLGPLLMELDRQALTTDTAFITGILELSEDGKVHNSIMAAGTGSGKYFKQRLVPVGEYAPLEEYLSGLFNFFSIPRSMIAPGPAGQQGLRIGAATLAPTICYEIVYPDLVAESALDSNILITISNDAWFGHSIGPNQHMQMARMRALETQRYLVRGTNNGISALVDDRGKLLVKSKSYVMDAIEGTVQLRTGSTPFMVLGSWPIVLICLLMLALCGFMQFKASKSTIDKYGW